MKIAFLSRYQQTTNRGGETFVRELASQLGKKHSVEVLTGSDADNLGKIIGGKYDIVIAMNGRLQGVKASIGRILGRYKLVIIGESGIGKDDIFNVAIAKPNAFVGITDYAIRVDKSEKLNWWQWLNRKMRVASTWGWGIKIVKIPNGVDIDKFQPQGEKTDVGLKAPIVLSVGALTWYKHHERTIEALSHLPKVSLLIVGKGGEEESLRELAQEKLGDRFKIISAPFEQLPAIYRSSDLFALPSWEREAFGIVYIEAMASGLSVVAPDDCPRREIVGNAGILVDVENPKKYAEAINNVLSTKWEDKPRKQAEKFSWEKVGEMYEKLFEDLIK